MPTTMATANVRGILTLCRMDTRGLNIKVSKIASAIGTNTACNQNNIPSTTALLTSIINARVILDVTGISIAFC